MSCETFHGEKWENIHSPPQTGHQWKSKRNDSTKVQLDESMILSWFLFWEYEWSIPYRSTDDSKADPTETPPQPDGWLTKRFLPGDPCVTLQVREYSVPRSYHSLWNLGEDLMNLGNSRNFLRYFGCWWWEIPESQEALIQDGNTIIPGQPQLHKMTLPQNKQTDRQYSYKCIHYHLMNPLNFIIS